jgi:arylsulfatase A-like enzyme
MRRRLVLITALMVGVAVQTALVGGQRSVPQSSRKPNVVLIIMDDMGDGDIGSYGVPDARTPNLDRLAREGVRLTDAYANGAVCTPTRTALISGRYQQRVGLEWALNEKEQDRGLPATGASLPALLKKNGYATGLVGLILAALDRHRLARDTLPIFTNDNGGEWLSRNAPLSHRKATLWEGGIRVPLILRWPNRLPAGKSPNRWQSPWI